MQYYSSLLDSINNIGTNIETVKIAQNRKKSEIEKSTTFDMPTDTRVNEMEVRMLI